MAGQEKCTICGRTVRPQPGADLGYLHVGRGPRRPLNGLGISNGWDHPAEVAEDQRRHQGQQRTAAQEWSETYQRLHARPGKRGPVRLSAKGARILRMLGPMPWESGSGALDIRGETLSWQPEMDSFVVGHAHDASFTGFPRGDAARILRAFGVGAGQSRLRHRHYADPGYQADRLPRYPLDSESEVRAAWGYVNHPDNARRYTAEQLRHIHSAIQHAGRRYGIQYGHARDMKFASRDEARAWLARRYDEQNERSNFTLERKIPKDLYLRRNLAAAMRLPGDARDKDDETPKPDAWKIAAERNGGRVPTSQQVAAVRRELELGERLRRAGAARHKRLWYVVSLNTGRQLGEVVAYDMNEADRIVARDFDKGDNPTPVPTNYHMLSSNPYGTSSHPGAEVFPDRGRPVGSTVFAKSAGHSRNRGMGLRARAALRRGTRR